MEEAELIARGEGSISACLHTPVKGKIVAIETKAHPLLKRGRCITVQSENADRQYLERDNIDSLEPVQILEIIKNSGIVGMGGAGFPTHIKLNSSVPIKTLIVNGCECEPYLSSDYCLMVEKSKEIFRGIEIAAKLIRPERIFFAVEDNKPEAIKKINFLISCKNFSLPEVKLAVLKSAYPQGGEKQLIFNLAGKKIPPGKIPADVGCLVHNVATLFAIYEAVYLDKPLIERLVCFYGDAVTTTKNIWVKIGTTLKEFFDQKILEFSVEPQKIIAGGPMMGVALDSLDYPILKTSSGFLFLKNPGPQIEEGPCLKCARCMDICPMDLMSSELVKRIKHTDYAALAGLHIEDCIECGCCTYVCPAKIPLLHYIKTGKQKLER